MMSRTDIYELLMLKLTGSLNTDDAAELDALIERDPEVGEAWNEVQRFYFEDEQRRKDFENVSAADIMDAVKLKRKQQQQRSFNIGAMIVAAAAIGAGIFIYPITKTTDTSKVLSAVHKNIPPKSIYLELENGEIFNLSGNEQYQKTEDGKVTLNNSRNTLTFIADRNNRGLNKLVVPPGKEYTVRLSDGTEMRMNAGSTLQFPFGFADKAREIFLTGEAYVKVATAPQQPFTVHTADATIQVLGTEFNVNTYNQGNAVISLVQGAVKVLAGKQEVILKPGLEAAYTTQKGFNTHPFDKNNVLSWLEGRYTFTKTPLGQIIPILERWYDIKIISDHPAVANKVFTGQINKSDGVEAFLEMLKIIGDADHYKTNDTIHIK